MSLPIHHVISAGPRPVAPFSHAVEADGFVFVTGQMPTDPKAPDAPLPEGVEAQTRRVFENLKAVLAAAGASFDDVVRVAIYMTDLVNFAAVNEVMKRYFREPHPARSTIGVAALPRGAAVEIDLIAVIGG